MYRVFGDESSDESKSRVFAVAGVFGDESDWKAIQEVWLERTGGTIFHGAECETDRGDFKNNSHSENQALYKDLTQLICRSKLAARAHAMDIAAWRAYFPLVPAEVPYLACFRNVIHRCGDLAKLMIPQDQVAFTFDNRPETKYNASVLYSCMVDLKGWDGSAYLSEQISFAGREYVGIQVADLVARETMKHLDNRIGPTRRRTRYSMAALSDTGRFEFTFHTQEYFADLSKWPSFGVDVPAYHAWLKEKGLVDNISNRQRHLREVIPPETATPESFFRKKE